MAVISECQSATRAKKPCDKSSKSPAVAGTQRSVRQELKRFQRKGLGYSKDLEMHKAGVALHFGIYNFVRIHKALGTPPAVAAGVEFEPWGLEERLK